MIQDTGGNANAAGRTSGWADRLADGLAVLTRDIATDLHAAYAGVFYGNGQINQPYLTGRSAIDQERGFDDIAEATLDGMREQLSGNKELDGRLEDLSNELSGRGQDGRDNPQERGQERGR